MNDIERVASELELAVKTLENWQYHPNVNTMTPQEIIALVKSVLDTAARNLGA